MKATRSFAMRLTLLIALVSAVSVSLVTALHVGLEIARARKNAIEFVRSQARVVAANSTAPLDFDDAEAAQGTLESLSTVPEIAAAALVRHRAGQGSAPTAEPFAAYHRDHADSHPPMPLMPVAQSVIDGRWLVHSEPVTRDGEQIGTLTLLYDFGPQRQRLQMELGVAILLSLGVLALAFAAARRVQRSLLAPVRELTAAAGAIAKNEDYSIRARKVSTDELGALTDVFNGMVARIAEADAIRRNHRAMLEAEVARVSAEVIETQARLRQSERMASLGTLSAGLGHDIGNLLMPLRAHLGAIRERAGASAHEADFAAIARATEYLQNLATSLRMLAMDPARAGPGQGPTSLTAWWEELEPILRAMVGHRIAIESDIPAGLPSAAISQPLLMQAVFNLVQNAAQALAPEGLAAPSGACIRITASLAPGPAPRLRLLVSDNGPGMSDEVKRRCLEPYFTTKTRRVSSGLGLALVKGIIDGAGGELAVESAPGKGATFTLLLPTRPEVLPVEPTLAVVRIGEPRRRAVVSHLLTSLNFTIENGPAPAGVDAAALARCLWVTDAVETVPGAWPGRVIIMNALAASSHIGATAAGRTMMHVDPATPPSALRGIFQSLLHGAS